MSPQPPKWADRFLEWYCNPDLLEEIQGDAYELYTSRVRTEGKTAADLKYVWDVIRFFRWSNVRRSDSGSYRQLLFNLILINLRISIRHARRDRSLYFIKMTSLVLSSVFGILLTGYILNEMTYDKFHKDHERIYRVTSKVNFGDHMTHYAVTPLPIGNALQEAIPEIESFTRFMFKDRPVFQIGEKIFHDEITLTADSNFLKILSYEFVYGDANALSGPNRVVLTESLARKFFGPGDSRGQTLLAHGTILEVTAIIKETPPNSHLQFDALISWDSFNNFDEWSNLNAYTYILLKPGVGIETVILKFPAVRALFNDLLVREYKATYDAVFENITSIHFSQSLDEDIATKKTSSHLYIAIVIAVLFFVTAFVNYANVTLAEQTRNLKRMGIVKIFGGQAGSYHRSMIFEAGFTILVAAPFVFLGAYAGLIAAGSFLGISINPEVFIHPVFLVILLTFLLMLIASSLLNIMLFETSGGLASALKGNLAPAGGRTWLRRVLVAGQLSFSIIMLGLILIISDQFDFIRNADKGLSDKNVMVLKLHPTDDTAAITALATSLRSLSGVEYVEWSTLYPGILETKYVFQVDGVNGMQELLVPMMVCSYDFLEALDIEISDGRGFNEENPADWQNAYIVNESAARKFGWTEAIGRKINGPVAGGGDYHREGVVIGVVKDFSFNTFHNAVEPLIIFPTDESWGYQFVYITFNQNAKSELVAGIAQQFKTQFPEQPFEWEHLDERFVSLYRNDAELREITEAGLFISLVVSALGIFSISALLLTMRTREMAIRKTIGATSIQLFYLHISRFFGMTIVSLLASWPVIWYLASQWLNNFVSHVSIGPEHFIVPGIIALIIILLASCIHGLKTAGVNPIECIKHE